MKSFEKVLRHFERRNLVTTLEKMENETLAGRMQAPDSFPVWLVGLQTLTMEVAWYYLMLYYVSLEAFRRRLSASFRMALVRPGETTVQ